jgi:hypothetical protein
MAFLGTVIQGLAAIASQVVALLPPAEDLGLSIPDGFVQGFSLFNQFLPLTELFALMGVLAAAAIATVAWHLGLTVYHLIPKPLSGT